MDAAFNKLAAEEEIAEDMSAGSLERFLEEYVWIREETKDHIDIDKLWELFARFVYMPRLKSKSVLVNAVASSVEEGLLGSADDYDEKSGKYENLQYEKKLWMLNDLRGLIVRKDAALLQHDLEREDARNSAPKRSVGAKKKKRRQKRLDPPKLPKLFTITKQTNLESLEPSMNDLMNEIMRTWSTAKCRCESS